MGIENMIYEIGSYELYLNTQTEIINICIFEIITISHRFPPCWIAFVGILCILSLK